MKVKSESEVSQLCLTFRHPMDCSPPGSSVHGIFQARVLEWGATAFSPQVRTGPKRPLKPTALGAEKWPADGGRCGAAGAAGDGGSLTGDARLLDPEDPVPGV